MAPLTPDLFLSCCISREKVFRGNGVTFREAGGRVRLCKLPSDAIATLQPHLSRKYAREKKNLPEKKKMPKEIKIAQDKKCLRKKNYQHDVASATIPQPQISENWYVSSKRWDFTTKCSKRRGKDPIPHIRNILHKHDYEQTLLLSSQYFHFMVAKHASFLGRTFALETNSIQ